MLTVAPGMAPPELSVMVPVMLPYRTCAAAVCGNETVTATAIAIADLSSTRPTFPPNTLASITVLLLPENECRTDEFDPDLRARSTTPMPPCQFAAFLIYL